MRISRREALSSVGALLALPAFATLRGAGFAGPGRDPSEFLDSVRKGDLARVRSMLERDAGLARAKDDAGRSAYVLAHVHGHEDVAAVVRATGIELDIVEAVLAEDWERFEAIATEHPELLNRVHPIGGSPLHAGALVGSLDFWRLRSAGCVPDTAPAGGTGFTAARAAMESAHGTWARISLTDLCSNGSDVNAGQRDGSSVLHGAVVRKDETLVRLAIRKGADIDAVDDAGKTAMALAEELGWETGAKLLAEHALLPRDNRSSRFALDANRDPVVRPDLSDVPGAMQSEVTGNSHFNLKRVRELVSSDQRLVFSMSYDDELAIEACAHTGAREVIRYHLDHGAPLSLPTAVSLGDRDAVSFWLERDRSLVHERGAHDFPVMWYAVLGGGSVGMAELLSGYGVPLDQESMGTTALHWCAFRNDPDLARWLVDHGADIDAVGFKWSRDGETPLQVAVRREDSKMAQLLRDLGAKR